MSRLLRKKRTDIELKSTGGITDLFDNAIKESWYINDAEYNYICETATDAELNVIVKKIKSLANKKMNE